MAKKKHTDTDTKLELEKQAQMQTILQLGDRIDVAAMRMEWPMNVLADEIDEMDESKAFQKIFYAPRLQGRVEMALYLAGMINRELRGESTAAC